MTEFHLHKHETLPTQMRSFLQGMRGNDTIAAPFTPIVHLSPPLIEAMPDTTLHFTSERSIVED